MILEYADAEEEPMTSGPGARSFRPLCTGRTAVARHHGRSAKKLFLGVRRQAALRRTSQTEAAMRITDSATSQPASMSWKCQNRLAGS